MIKSRKNLNAVASFISVCFLWVVLNVESRNSEKSEKAKNYKEMLIPFPILYVKGIFWFKIQINLCHLWEDKETVIAMSKWVQRPACKQKATFNTNNIFPQIGSTAPNCIALIGCVLNAEITFSWWRMTYASAKVVVSKHPPLVHIFNAHAHSTHSTCVGCWKHMHTGAAAAGYARV